LRNANSCNGQRKSNLIQEEDIDVELEILSGEVLSGTEATDTGLMLSGFLFSNFNIKITSLLPNPL
jgi:Na+-transporting NADH:ubiquinone oxidoreductase subunit NqrA